MGILIMVWITLKAEQYKINYKLSVDSSAHHQLHVPILAASPDAWRQSIFIEGTFLIKKVAPIGVPILCQRGHLHKCFFFFHIFRGFTSCRLTLPLSRQKNQPYPFSAIKAKEKKNQNDEEEWRMRLIMTIKATWTFWRVGRPQHEMGHNMIERSM
ncbi:hypothetical protein RUM43_005286 [Polyplax serrata]|uniref:Uncharacterized protein n=1 Tax=Polyplax serrata TaxID=468196 RepID=A0AAN8PB17_POLSC